MKQDKAASMHNQMNILVRAQSMRASVGRKAAFTLVEMLVVITIIALLLSIAVPSIYKVRQNIYVSMSRATIRVIEDACKSFNADVGNYPPAGKYNLYTKLGQPVSKPSGKGSWGPYLDGTTNMKIADLGGIVYVDAFRNPILYYVWNGNGFTGDAEANGNLFAKNPSGQWYRKDFLLMSLGAEVSWPTDQATANTANIATNLLSE